MKVLLISGILAIVLIFLPSFSSAQVEQGQQSQAG
jgi:hypothetical protein